MSVHEQEQRAHQASLRAEEILHASRKPMRKAERLPPVHGAFPPSLFDQLLVATTGVPLTQRRPKVVSETAMRQSAL